MDPVASLIVDESPKVAQRLAIIDAPELITAAREITGDIRVWCDDAREANVVPEEMRFTELTGDIFEDVDLVWMKLPKALGALDEYAELIALYASPEVEVVAGGRVKHMTTSMNEVLASHFGHVHASLGRQKSRVLHASIPFDEPLSWPRRKTHADLKLTLWGHGATFGINKVDVGTRLLLSHIREVKGPEILDFGSGNGVLSVMLARWVPRAKITATDVSWAAASATARSAKENRVTVDAHWLADLNDWPDEIFDSIVTNPPFHQGTTKDSSGALEIFTTGARLLRPGGEFWVVFNSHLPWKAELTRLVGPTKVIEQNTGYTLTRSIKR